MLLKKWENESLHQTTIDFPKKCQNIAVLQTKNILIWHMQFFNGKLNSRATIYSSPQHYTSQTMAQYSVHCTVFLFSLFSVVRGHNLKPYISFSWKEYTNQMDFHQCSCRTIELAYQITAHHCYQQNQGHVPVEFRSRGQVMWIDSRCCARFVVLNFNARRTWNYKQMTR
jgi:hypothetical protein